MHANRLVWIMKMFILYININNLTTQYVVATGQHPIIPSWESQLSLCAAMQNVCMMYMYQTDFSSFVANWRWWPKFFKKYKDCGPKHHWFPLALTQTYKRSPSRDTLTLSAALLSLHHHQLLWQSLECSMRQRFLSMWHPKPESSTCPCNNGNAIRSLAIWSWKIIVGSKCEGLFQHQKVMNNIVDGSVMRMPSLAPYATCSVLER